MVLPLINGTGILTIGSTASSGKVTVQAQNSLGTTQAEIDINIEEGITVFDRTVSGLEETLTDEHGIITLTITEDGVIPAGTQVQLSHLRKKMMVIGHSHQRTYLNMIVINSFLTYQNHI